jgi:PIN domain nuclease of toxin-antitoxin system
VEIEKLYLDTHALVWLYASGIQNFSPQAVDCIEAASRLLISPIVEMETELLYEIGKITVPAAVIVHYLSERIDLRICSHPFHRVVAQSLEMKWTRDPFDRLITAQASLERDHLLTKDRNIRTQYPYAAW